MAKSNIKKTTAKYWKLTKKAMEYALTIVAVLWVVQIVQSVFGLHLASFGIYPRTLSGAVGIITAPLIHGNFQHLVANTLPMFILSTLILLFYKKKAFQIYFLIWITAGAFTWIIGRSALHIGASSIIYALATFLFFGGLFSKKTALILVSVIVFLLYAGLIWGIFPGSPQVSWEGHLSGALSGLLWAYIFRKNLESV